MRQRVRVVLHCSAGTVWRNDARLHPRQVLHNSALRLCTCAPLNHPAFEMSLPFLKRSHTVISALQIQSRERASADVEKEVKGGFFACQWW